MELSTDNPMLNQGAKAMCCKVLLSTMLTYNVLGDPHSHSCLWVSRQVTLGETPIAESFHQLDRMRFN